MFKATSADFCVRCKGPGYAFIIALVFSAVLTGPVVCADDSTLPELTEVRVTSTLDGNEQPVLYWCPNAAKRDSSAEAAGASTPLFVFLHSWSSDYKQNNDKWLREAVRKNWVYLHPNFRGANRSPKACGSKFARQDILDAMDWASAAFNVDADRIYLCGVSGGGHMSMLMAGHHPDRFTAVSAWVGISDLAEWYRFHLKDGKPQKYAQMILKSLGAAPGTSESVDADYRDRSPLFHMHRAGKLHIDLFAGVNDGHTGSVPVSHSIRAFNEIAKVHGHPVVTKSEMEQLWEDRKLQQPTSSDVESDAVLGREIFLRRTSNAARITIFDGGHESIPAAAIDGLLRETQRRDSSLSTQSNGS